MLLRLLSTAIKTLPTCEEVETNITDCTHDVKISIHFYYKMNIFV